MRDAAEHLPTIRSCSYAHGTHGASVTHACGLNLCALSTHACRDTRPALQNLAPHAALRRHAAARCLATPRRGHDAQWRRVGRNGGLALAQHELRVPLVTDGVCARRLPPRRRVHSRCDRAQAPQRVLSAPCSRQAPGRLGHCRPVVRVRPVRTGPTLATPAPATPWLRRERRPRPIVPRVPSRSRLQTQSPLASAPCPLPLPLRVLL